jgi:hypothetical protein
LNDYPENIAKTEFFLRLLGEKSINKISAVSFPDTFRFNQQFIVPPPEQYQAA